METDVVAILNQAVEVAVWCCRLVAAAIGVMLFRFVSLRSML